MNAPPQCRKRKQQIIYAKKPEKLAVAHSVKSVNSVTPRKIARIANSMAERFGRGEEPIGLGVPR